MRCALSVAALASCAAAQSPACVAELEKGCGPVRGQDGVPDKCGLCIIQNQAALTAAGCNIQLGTQDDAYDWCHGINPPAPTPPAPPTPPAGDQYRCVNDVCTASATGTSKAGCESICAAPPPPPPAGDAYRCVNDVCVVHAGGVAKAACESVCTGALAAPRNVSALPIEKKQVTVGGFKCDTIQTATVYYPSDASAKYPLLAFAHGWTEGGPNVAINYRDVIQGVAAAGYVVIAEESCLSKLDFVSHKADQLRALEYIKETSEFSDRVDWGRKVGVYGHSMGGWATGANAGDSAAIAKYNLGAAVCHHPAGTVFKTTIPTFFFTGSADTICPSPLVKADYTGAAPPKVYADITGATHFACQTSEAGIPQPHKETAAAINWMNCYIKGVQSDCDIAYDVCTGTSPAGAMTECTSDRGSGPSPPGPAPTPPVPVPPPPPPPAPSAACVAELEEDCPGDQGNDQACSLCVLQNAADLRTAGCNIVLGTHDDAWVWCHQTAASQV